MKATFTVDITIDVPGPGRTAANVQAVDQWHTIKDQLDALDGAVIDLKRMRLSAGEPVVKAGDVG